MQNKVQLIAYADRLGGSLQGLKQLMDSSFRGVYAGVHLLPFFTPYDGADAGFDPVDHRRVDPRLGDWADIKDLSGSYSVMADMIVNHVSAHSAMFEDFLRRGEESDYADFFLTLSSVFPQGASEEDLARIYRPRPGLPFTPYTCGGRGRLVWTTFTPEQIDINTQSEAGQQYVTSIMDTFAAAGISQIRLDAVGYSVKTAGSTCFLTESTFAFIDQLRQAARLRGLEVLVEVHSYYKKQVEIAHQVDWVYDFALPPLLLHALFTGDTVPLAEWTSVRPTNAINVLDTHDGIGIIDVGRSPDDPSAAGLLADSQIEGLLSQLHRNTQGESLQATGAAASNLDLYQVNSTYYSALGCDDQRYLAARAVQLFLPGIPQIYYVGALAGRNDMGLLARTGVGRDINRHYYAATEIAADLQRPVVQALNALCRFRNQHPAFNGRFNLRQEPAGQDGTAVIFEWSDRSSDHTFARLSFAPAPATTGGPAGPYASGQSAVAVEWRDSQGSHRLENLLADYSSLLV